MQAGGRRFDPVCLHHIVAGLESGTGGCGQERESRQENIERCDESRMAEYFIVWLLGRMDESLYLIFKKMEEVTNVVQ